MFIYGRTTELGKNLFLDVKKQVLIKIPEDTPQHTVIDLEAVPIKKQGLDPTK